MTPMSDARTPAEIARGLSVAQRRALLWLPEDGGWRHFRLVKGGVSARAINDLLRMDAADSSADGWRLTPLGLLVRAALTPPPAAVPHTTEPEQC